MCSIQPPRAFLRVYGYTAGMQKEVVKLAELGAFAKNVLEGVARSATNTHATILALSGNLGAGKTTLTQALARVLGVAENVQSPTYVLMKSYAIDWQHYTRLVHIDAYRLEVPEQFSALKPESFLNDPHVLVVVEWPEHVVGVLPIPNLTLHLSSEGCAEGERIIVADTKQELT